MAYILSHSHIESQRRLSAVIGKHQMQVQLLWNSAIWWNSFYPYLYGWKCM